MDTPTTPAPDTPRKKMPAEVFERIWKDPEGMSEWWTKEKNLSEWVPYVEFIETENRELKVVFQDIEVDGEIHIVNNPVLFPRVDLRNCKISTCHFENSKIKSLSLFEGSQVEVIRVRSGSVLSYLDVANSTVGLIRLQNSSIDILTIEEKSRVAKLHIWQGTLQRIRIRTGSFVSHARCQFSPQAPTHFVADRSMIGHLDFDDKIVYEFSTISVSSCSVRKLSMVNFCNYGSVFFSGLLPIKDYEDFRKDNNDNPIYKNGNPTFEVQKNAFAFIHFADSDLGKMQFINCDLRQFRGFEFTNTKMMDVFMAGSRMPDNNSFTFAISGSDSALAWLGGNKLLARKIKIGIAEQKRLAYGQFKKIYEARGDIAGSLPYLAYEMDAYREQLQMEGWLKNRGELFMLWMNKLSTNYGVSWQRGLGVTALAVAFFYSVFCYLIGYPFENDSPDDLERFWKLASYAPYYLNPLRDLDSVALIKDEELTPGARIWDFVSRIFVAYFVYQTIQAFRKLGKSSG